MSRILRGLLPAGLLACCVVGVGSARALAQTAATTTAPVATQAPGGSIGFTQIVPTFQSLHDGHRNTDRTVVQWRRFRDDHGQFTSVRERLEVDADGTDHAPFAVTFLGVLGELPGSTLSNRWMLQYRRFASLFFRHGEFRVRDAQSAQQNYTLHDFGQVVRANRPAHRVVVFPTRFDKAIWVLDVDDATSVPLYTAEYDMQLRLMSEIEVETFAPNVGTFTPYVPSMIITPQASFRAAKAFLGGVSGLLELHPTLTAEYTLGRVEISENPLNGQRTMVLVYTDGIDAFFVTEAPGVSSAFEGLPGQGKALPGQTIGRYRDPALSVLLFWDDGVGYQIAGRGSLQRLDDFAHALYAKALLTH